MALYEAVRTVFDQYGAAILGVSVDGVWCHRAFAEARGITFPLLSDFEPKGEVSREYGAYNAKTGESHRALFVLDRDGKVAWSYLSPSGENPGADGILNALESLP
jgi:peroxiredoxin